MIRRIEKNRLMKTIRLVLMWLAVFVLLVIKYAQSTFGIEESLYFSGMLFPVILGTSLYFNYVLVPKYLLKQNYRVFGLYAFYLLIISVYLETWVVVLSLVLIADYQFSSLSPEVADIVNMALLLYAIVFIHGFSVLFQHFVKQKKTNEGLILDQRKEEERAFVVVSQRKQVRIDEPSVRYVESLSDYVKIHLKEGEVIVTKATITSLESALSEDFVRIHRSFLVNKHHVTSFTREKVMFDDLALNITRKFKESALQALAQ
ncbi:hypothetical protein BFP97_03240 [Roseivirga sp. 4D4]|uniref:LytR/AlgR family response regulator transcription factor n=1 Tax=Roseivirga sp. 4D4 TaxID=1889784 RepID=UPI0008536878|nr:LytTR family DNA-binding domain-containing protein [Roseivirga sp. 4D4]OEK00579.1 hypothetical protein BFP97_03240 [Roseivirga sp. 4D4]